MARLFRDNKGRFATRAVLSIPPLCHRARPSLSHPRAIEVCQLLLSDGAHPDEWADRMTALDLAEAHQHARAVGLLRRQGARRFLELPPAKQKVPMSRSKKTGAQRTSNVKDKSTIK